MTFIKENPNGRFCCLPHVPDLRTDQSPGLLQILGKCSCLFILILWMYPVVMEVLRSVKSETGKSPEGRAWKLASLPLRRFAPQGETELFSREAWGKFSSLRFHRPEDHHYYWVQPKVNYTIMSFMVFHTRPAPILYDFKMKEICSLFPFMLKLMFLNHFKTETEVILLPKWKKVVKLCRNEVWSIDNNIRNH